MAAFWFWGVRNPCLVLAAGVLAAGLYGVADDAITYSLLLVFGLIADVAAHRGRRARSRELRAQAVQQALREAEAARQRVQQRKAA